MTMVRLPHLALRRAAMPLAFALAVVCLIMARDRQANAACGVYCTALNCLLDSNATYYQYQNGQVCNWWWNATAGCAPNACTGVGTVNLQYQAAAMKANICPALPQLNTPGQSQCKNPAGQLFPSACYAGCTPVASASTVSP